MLIAANAMVELEMEPASFFRVLGLTGLCVSGSGRARVGLGLKNTWILGSEFAGLI